MSKEELLKYLIAEIDLIMHDKDYRFENANGTWYSRESCRHLTNEEVFEEQRTELRQFADLEAKLADSEEEHELLIDQFEEETEKLRKQIKQESDARKRFVEEVKELKQQLAEKDAELEKWSTQYAKAYVDKQNALIAEKVELQHQLAEKDEEIESLKHFKVTIGTMETNQVDISSTTYIDQDKISFALEQLEKIINLFEPYENEEKDTILCANNGTSFLEYIDNQINELKGKVE